ncbi:hypothetical protein MAR_004587 [Mya arenaria]|uniref:Uncharacterized protein n=1 Tax=Mya arenaria TaxID=6604 RepID=A0ABY7EX06_MYAAR|nr:uncharacterized protein LOC128203259 [Mya arenaria]WAR14482.1 hypothetical protein MAR_004587 [Mya arenaria]
MAVLGNIWIFVFLILIGKICSGLHRPSVSANMTVTLRASPASRRTLREQYRKRMDTMAGYIRSVPATVLTHEHPVVHTHTVGGVGTVAAHTHQHGEAGTVAAHIHQHGGAGTVAAHTHQHSGAGTVAAHIHQHGGAGTVAAHTLQHRNLLHDPRPAKENIQTVPLPHAFSQTRRLVPRQRINLFPPLVAAPRMFTRQHLQEALGTFAVTPIPVVKTNPMPLVSPASANDRMQNFLKILQDRKSVLSNEKDAKTVKQHLFEINAFNTERHLNGNSKIDKQVTYIEQIGDPIVKREVFKIYVKDLVEKSGFLTGSNVQTSEIESLKALVNKIEDITSRVEHSIEPLQSRIIQDTPVNSPLVSGNADVFGHSSVHVGNTLKPHVQGPVSEGILLADNILLSEHTIQAPRNNRDAVREKLTQTLSDIRSLLDNTRARGRAAAQVNPVSAELSSLVGKSIFGDRNVDLTIFGDVLIKPTTQAPSVIQQTTTRELTAIAIQAEVMGGTSSYWTHLRSGLADLLCSFCQKQGRQDCIKIYCSNVVEKATPSPLVTIAR